MVTIYYTEDGSKCIYAPTTVRGVKPDHHANLSPLKDRLTENNEKNVVENGVDADQTMVTGKVDGDTNRYLHKKFKKVATLEEASPPKVKSDDESQPGSPGAGRYVCPYCKLACAKPSVLQKHIRAHTNERPFPCLPCGFAFKTKSNLYKHCRSRAHTQKIDDPSSEEEDSSKVEPNVTAVSDMSNEQSKNKIYKPKFRSATLYTAEEVQPKLQLSIPTTGSNSAQSSPSSFSTGTSPSPEFLQRHISKLISDNQAIVDEVFWPLKPKHKDSPPPSPALKNGDSDASSQSKLALALLKPQRPITPEVGEPLNLTTKEPRKRSISESVIRVDGVPENSIIKDILLKSHSAGSLEARERGTLDLLYCPNCKVTFKSSENLEIHLRHCQDLKEGPSVTIVSPGPLLGNTPLVDGFQKDNEPLLKRRKLDSWLRKDDLLKSPGKSVHLFGGEVQIHDSGKTKTFRIEPSRKDSYVEQNIIKPEQVLTISKTGLHCAGGTILHTAIASPKSPVQEKLVLPIKTNIVTPNLSVPGLIAPIQVPLALNPLTNITAFNPLTLPKPSPTSGGLVTILHGGKPIPYVPGMPGPHSVLPLQPAPLPKKPEKPSVIVTSIKSNKSPDLTIKVPPTIRVDAEERRSLEEPKLSTSPRESPSTSTSEVVEKKFLRPTSLPLKPGTYTPKRNPTTPHLTLVSPETPRPRKSYGQLYLNGHAYTYLGLKCSTRTFFCTLNKPQPIYVSLIPDQYKVSMYSNWTICSDSNPHPLGIEPKKAMSLYDSRNRSGTYTLANKNKEDLMTHSSYYHKIDQATSKSDLDEKCISPDEGCSTSRVKVCEGGFESNEDYIYVRGRGRGRYVCEECGIRCKKPSMLKKHIRTHTDLRPYTCRHCAFSFKTKGNLTKHMKSKAHYKKCVELGIFPVPVSCEDSFDDDNEQQKLNEGDSRSETAGEDSEEETDEDEEDDEDDEESEDEEGDECRTEREVARSLLSLSEVTLETAHKRYVKAGLVPALSRPRTYPYTLSSTQVVETKLDNGMKCDSWRGSSEYVSSDSKDFSDSSMCSIESAPESVRPIDLSSKTPKARTPGPKTPVTPLIPSVGGQAHLLKTICSTTEKAPLVGGGVTEPAENPTLLQTYLTERAAHDSRIKQRQLCTDDVTIGGDMIGAKESALGVLAMTMAGKPPSPKMKGKAEFMPPASGPSVSFISSTEDGRSMCGVCNKVFNKPSQLRLHVNIHFFERPFRCESCAVSFRTKGHLQKHQRSLSHLNKVNMNSTFGTATSSNPRPFKCDDCKIAFRIHGHLAKHLRSKMHIMKLECLGKLPFGTYAELERSGMNMNDIDTTDCENSLESLQMLAQKLYEKDPSKLGAWEPAGGDSTSEDEPDGQQKADAPSQAAKNQNMCQPIDGKECNETDDSLR